MFVLAGSDNVYRQIAGFILAAYGCWRRFVNFRTQLFLWKGFSLGDLPLPDFFYKVTVWDPVAKAMFTMLDLPQKFCLPCSWQMDCQSPANKYQRNGHGSIYRHLHCTPIPHKHNWSWRQYPQKETWIKNQCKFFELLSILQDGLICSSHFKCFPYWWLNLHCFLQKRSVPFKRSCVILTL